LTSKEEIDLAQRIEHGRTAREELARGQVISSRRNELYKSIEDGWLPATTLLQPTLAW